MYRSQAIYIRKPGGEWDVGQTELFPHCRHAASHHESSNFSLLQAPKLTYDISAKLQFMGRSYRCIDQVNLNGETTS